MITVACTSMLETVVSLEALAHSPARFPPPTQTITLILSLATALNVRRATNPMQACPVRQQVTKRAKTLMNAAIRSSTTVLNLQTAQTLLEATFAPVCQAMWAMDSGAIQLLPFRRRVLHRTLQQTRLPTIPPLRPRIPRPTLPLNSRRNLPLLLRLQHRPTRQRRGRLSIRLRTRRQRPRTLQLPRPQLLLRPKHRQCALPAQRRSRSTMTQAIMFSAMARSASSSQMTTAQASIGYQTSMWRRYL